jgi:curli biogenesis system outer membrane secretion channel CsgG
MQVNTVKTNRTGNAAARRHGVDHWGRRLLVGLALWWLALGACAQDWGLQLRDDPGGQAAEVVSVVPGSPAAAAGLRAGDRISQAQNFLVRNVQDYLNIVRLSEGRGSLLLRVSRDGWEKELSLAAPSAARGPAAPVVPVMPSAPPRAWFGMQVADALPGTEGGGAGGVAVTGVAAGGPAAQAGIRSGDVIVRIDGRPLSSAAELADLIGNWPIGRSLRLAVQREGWVRELVVQPGVLSPSGNNPPPLDLPRPAVRAPAAVSPPTDVVQPAPPAQRSGNKAVVTIGDFQVKAANASQSIGDGLREMLVTALYNSGGYIVVERMDLQGLAAEQALSRSRMARQGSAVPEQRMDVADVIVHGAVTEFEGEAKGSAAQLSVPRLPFSFGRDAKTAHMAIDVRVVDVATGRILGAQRIVGDAQSSKTTLSAEPSARGVGIPVGLGMFQNTPMEAAIRSCVEKAVAYVGTTIPASYFSRR